MSSQRVISTWPTFACQSYTLEEMEVTCKSLYIGRHFTVRRDTQVLSVKVTEFHFFKHQPFWIVTWRIDIGLVPARRC